MIKHMRSTALLVVMAVSLLAGCGGETTSPTPVAGTDTNAAPTTAASDASSCTNPDKLKLQLKWLHQAQFAGYYVAADKGYYKQVCLDVELLPGGPDVVPSQKVSTGAA